MNTTGDYNTSDSLRETLTAYLDGELSEQQQREIEELLARDEGARREMHQLERVWDALDQLPRAELDTRFAQTTVEMVALAAEDEIRQERDAAPRRRRRTRLLVGASFVAALFTGYLLAGAFVERRDDRLARDLPLLENLDAYRQVQDYEFLELLAREDLFVKGEGPDAR